MFIERRPPMDLPALRAATQRAALAARAEQLINDEQYRRITDGDVSVLDLSLAKKLVKERAGYGYLLGDWLFGTTAVFQRQVRPGVGYNAAVRLRDAIAAQLSHQAI